MPTILRKIEATSGPMIRKYFIPYLSDKCPNAGWVRLHDIKLTAVKILTRKRERSSFSVIIGINPTMKEA
jgi:competence transcription factor ComK